MAHKCTKILLALTHGRVRPTPQAVRACHGLPLTDVSRVCMGQKKKFFLLLAYFAFFGFQSFHMGIFLYLPVARDGSHSAPR